AADPVLSVAALQGRTILAGDPRRRGGGAARRRRRGVLEDRGLHAVGSRLRSRRRAVCAFRRIGDARTRADRPDRADPQHGGDWRHGDAGRAAGGRLPRLCAVGMAARRRRLPVGGVRGPGGHLRPLLPRGPVGPRQGRGAPLEAGMTLLSVNGITKRYGGLTAVDDVSFDILAGELVGLIGPNGSGKTTLLNILSGLARADSGEILLDDTPCHGLTPEQLAHRGVMRMFQLTRVFRRMNVVDNLLVAGRALGLKPAEALE